MKMQLGFPEGQASRPSQWSVPDEHSPCRRLLQSFWKEARESYHKRQPSLANMVKPFCYYQGGQPKDKATYQENHREIKREPEKTRILSVVANCYPRIFFPLTFRAWKGGGRRRKEWERERDIERLPRLQPGI